jgi:hypothetical protein
MKTPKPPDPYETAAAQGGANRDAAVTSSIVNNPNEVGPYGDVSYSFEPGDTYTRYDVEGNAYQVARPTRTTNLSEDQQTILDQNSQLGISTNELAQSQVDRISNVVDKPMDLEGIDPAQRVGSNDFAGDRDRIEQALMGRLDEYSNRDREALDARLAAQGTAVGHEAYGNEMDRFETGVNRNRVDMIMAAGQEQQRLAQMEQAEAGFNNQTRQGEVGEAFALRNQPFNEISALSGAGGQLAVPTGQATYRQGIEAAPVANSVYQTAQMRQDAANQFNQGMFSLAGSAMGGAGAAYGSDRRLKKNIEHVGFAANGLKLYLYHYKTETDNSPRRLGLMADEVKLVNPDAVTTHDTGYDIVDYDKALDL